METLITMSLPPLKQPNETLESWLRRNYPPHTHEPNTSPRHILFDLARQLDTELAAQTDRVSALKRRLDKLEATVNEGHYVESRKVI